MTSVDILLQSVYIHREEERITFFPRKNHNRILFSWFGNRMFCLKFLIQQLLYMYFKDNRVCFNMHSCGVMKSFWLQFYFKPTFSSVSKIKAAFYRTAACHGPTTATEKKAAGCLQITLSHVYILNVRQPLVFFKKENNNNKKSQAKIILCQFILNW